MTTRVTIEVDSFQPVYDRLNALGQKLSDVKKPLDQAHAALLSNIMVRFRQETNPDGTKWKKSKAAEIRSAGGFTWSHGKKVTGGHTLFATGQLWRSIQAYSKKAEKPRDRRTIGTNHPEYKYFHEPKAGSVNTKRVIIGLSVKDVEVFRAIVLRHLEF